MCITLGLHQEIEKKKTLLQLGQSLWSTNRQNQIFKNFFSYDPNTLTIANAHGVSHHFLAKFNYKAVFGIIICEVKMIFLAQFFQIPKSPGQTGAKISPQKNLNTNIIHTYVYACIIQIFHIYI